MGGLLLTPKDGSGYGYLSENAEFADSAVKAGLTFIGPRGESIRTIGDKVCPSPLSAGSMTDEGGLGCE